MISVRLPTAGASRRCLRPPKVSAYSTSSSTLQFSHASPLSRLPSIQYKKSQHNETRRNISSGSGKPPSFSGRIHAWWQQDGSLLIALGWTGLALLVVDRYLQYTDRRDADRLVGYLTQERTLKRAQLLQQHQDSPVLFECVVRQKYKMGGSHGLTGDVQIGDVIQVLQEGVGPGGSYNLCRTRDKEDGQVIVGWYPIGFLQKLPAKKENT